ncbi:tetratricopeptide repeat domain-containing protein [Pseudovirgaria hyperparasitica]|uniref:Tetratricopeptide repeat domain-containing protein n=1 Tax=Pseudovirgaria hyperparasitica TaxID=470096 RepID=A0A6A6W578_9PEZI|nr:tetratricopeptide repeat domain-containing protein [Pseudovirgaria hyperparasitica]KAF2756211.1 tetratricopeptide repeat domain-containing protein [Pseudovirgaria hyperparasitica]
MDTFTQLPIHMDPQTKAITTTHPTPALTTELTTLNALHKTLLSLDGPNTVPPPPVPVNPKRTAQINKLHESGNAAFKKESFADAIKLYGLAINMALQRPLWEPNGLVKEEVAGLYANRAQAHMQLRDWVAGAADAQCSVEMKRAGNGKAWWRRGRCLLEMGRVEEARVWTQQALEQDGEVAELKQLAKEIAERLKK